MLEGEQRAASTATPRHRTPTGRNGRHLLAAAIRFRRSSAGCPRGPQLAPPRKRRLSVGRARCDGQRTNQNEKRHSFLSRAFPHSQPNELLQEWLVRGATWRGRTKLNRRRHELPLAGSFALHTAYSSPDKANEQAGNLEPAFRRPKSSKDFLCANFAPN